MKKERLRIENLRKGTLLKRIQFQIYEGEIIHCIFDNIQEKYMFLQIMTGKEELDYGRVYYEERLITEKRVSRLLREKITVISRESNLINSISIGENMFLIRQRVEKNWVSNREYKKKATEIFKEFGISIDVEKPMKKLSDYEKVQIEIMKAYLVGRKIVILTALSNSLSSKEMRGIMRLLEKIRIKGVSFIIIDPLEDIDFESVDTVVIIKHGKTYAIKDAEDCDYMMLHTILYHDEMEKRANGRLLLFETFEEKQEVEIKNLSSEYLQNISLTVAKGEIVKLFCIDEKSYEEITGVLRGELPVYSGSIVAGNKVMEIKKNIKGLKYGIGVAEGNPAASTLFEELSVMDNLQILLSKKAAGIWIVPKYRKSIKILLKDIIGKDIYKKQVNELSPTDVQKVLYSKWLLYSPEILVCIQPFAEGDIQAREMARKMLYTLKERKIPILVITSNTAELNYCSGRDMYIRHGKMIEKDEAYRFLYSES